MELKNVQGKPGWLHGGAKIIAFDMPEEGGFSVLDRVNLLEWVDQNISSEVVTDKRMASGKMYQRKDRQDQITKLNLQDLKSLSSYRVWKYFDDY